MSCVCALKKYFAFGMLRCEICQAVNLAVIVHRTIWYELLCLEWPFQKLPPESIIWQVGKGMKPSLTHIQASRDVKVLFLVSLFNI